MLRNNSKGNGMTQNSALQAVQEQLAYWTKECEAARRSVDQARIAQCERFIAQCELVLSALKTSRTTSAK